LRLEARQVRHSAQKESTRHKDELVFLLQSENSEKEKEEETKIEFGKAFHAPQSEDGI
jgi:hypothetical protein